MTARPLPPSALPRRPALRRDLLAPLSRKLSSTSSATADLYLGFSCADHLATGGIERLAPTVFRAGRTLIIARHDSGLEQLPEHDRLIYIIDDNWRAGLSDKRLPAWYRMKLALIEGRAASRLERSADVVLTSSRRLAAVFRQLGNGQRVDRIEPAWPRAQSPLPPETGCATRLAYLGAATHQDDARWVISMIGRLLDSDPQLHLYWSGNHPLPKSWLGDMRINVVPSMGWAGYRKWMRSHSFDIGLYPLLDGGFNAARSVNKLGEYDQFGAAVCASRRWTSARPAADKGACVLISDDPRRWRYELRRLLDEPGRAHRIAAANRRMQGETALRRQRALWSGLLPHLDWRHPLPPEKV